MKMFICWKCIIHHFFSSWKLDYFYSIMLCLVLHWNDCCQITRPPLWISVWLWPKTRHLLPLSSNMTPVHHKSRQNGIVIITECQSRRIIGWKSYRVNGIFLQLDYIYFYCKCLKMKWILFRLIVLIHPRTIWQLGHNTFLLLKNLIDFYHLFIFNIVFEDIFSHF